MPEGCMKILNKCTKGVLTIASMSSGWFWSFYPSGYAGETIPQTHGMMIRRGTYNGCFQDGS